MCRRHFRARVIADKGDTARGWAALALSRGEADAAAATAAAAEAEADSLVLCIENAKPLIAYQFLLSELDKWKCRLCCLFGCHIEAHTQT